MYDEYKQRSDAALWDESQRMAEIQKVKDELERRELVGKERLARSVYVLGEVEKLFALLKDNKPNDRTEQDRLWAIAVTDMQKLRSFFRSEVVNG